MKLSSSKTIKGENRERIELKIKRNETRKKKQKEKEKRKRKKRVDNYVLTGTYIMASSGVTVPFLVTG